MTDTNRTPWRTESILPSPPRRRPRAARPRVPGRVIPSRQRQSPHPGRRARPEAAGVYIPDDPEPLTMHHMQVTLEVEFPSRIIVSVEARLLAYPHDLCPSIEQHYNKLVGLSIARGFTNTVRELFGGPRDAATPPPCSRRWHRSRCRAPRASSASKPNERVSRIRSSCDRPVRAGRPSPTPVTSGPTTDPQGRGRARRV